MISVVGISNVRNQGFSLLELLIAIGLAALILGVGTGLAFQGLSAERKLSRAGDQIELAARKAAKLSTKDRRNLHLVLRDDGIAKMAELEADMQLLYKRANEFDDWQSPPSSGYHWTFLGNGMVEPIAIKLVSDSGELTMSFDPLTGQAIDRSLIVQ